jgi:prepilin-type N-terminal cleavage/methylation domain-containing protein
MLRIDNYATVDKKKVAVMSTGRSRCGTQGFALAELVIVISIIAILASLGIPAIQAAREAARRTQCRNNVMQLALALHNYYDMNQVFPAGTDFLETDTGPTLWSWQMKVLPYCENRVLYDQIDYLAGVTGKANRSVIEQSIAVFHCPSDPAVLNVFDCKTGDFAGRWSLTNYLGMSGTTGVQLSGTGLVLPSRCDAFEDHGEKTNDGLLFGSSHVWIGEISDGTSTTLLVGERGIYGEGQSGWWTGPGLAGGCPSGWTDVVLPGENVYGLGGLRPMTGEFDDPLHWWSHHSEAAHFALADGSVRLINYSIDPKTFLKLCTRAAVPVPVPDSNF